MHERPLSLSFDPADQILYVGGFVDELSGVALRDAVRKHSREYTEPLVVDLTDVDFLPSLGVGVLAVALRTAEENNVSLELVTKDGTVSQQVLNICGLPYTAR